MNRIISEELSVFHRQWPVLEETTRKMETKIRFPFEWVNLLIQEAYFVGYYSAMVLHTFTLVNGISLPSGEDSLKWKCFCEATSFLFLSCAIDQYVSLILGSVEGELIFSGFTKILKVSGTFGIANRKYLISEGSLLRMTAALWRIECASISSASLLSCVRRTSLTFWTTWVHWNAVVPSPLLL